MSLSSLWSIASVSQRVCSWRTLQFCQESEEEWTAIELKNHCFLVHTVAVWYQGTPQQEYSAQGSQICQYLPYQKLQLKNRRFWYLESVGKVVGYHLHRHPALSVSLGMQQPALWTEFRYVGPWLHRLRNVRTQSTSSLIQYPFEASNMIVLAKKIVMDDVAPLPSHYSPELNDIVMYEMCHSGKCLSKTARKE